MSLGVGRQGVRPPNVGDGGGTMWGPDDTISIEAATARRSPGDDPEAAPPGRSGMARTVCDP